jgi:hypothetical protein
MVMMNLVPFPSEAIFDKIALSAFEGTPLNMALCDCGINALIIVGIAMEEKSKPRNRFQGQFESLQSRVEV